MNKKKILLTSLVGVVLGASLVGCNKNTTNNVATNTDAISEGATTVNIYDINSITDSDSDWKVSRLYLDTAKEQYEQNKSETLKNIIDYSESDEATGYIFLASKKENGNVVYAYEASEKGTDDIVVLYVTVDKDGAVTTKIGPTSDEDEILLGIKNSEETSTETDTAKDIKLDDLKK